MELYHKNGAVNNASPVNDIFADASIDYDLRTCSDDDIPDEDEHDVFSNAPAPPSRPAAAPRAAGPSRPQVKRPRSRSFVKCPIEVLAELVRQGVLKKGDIPIILAFADHSSKLSSSQRSLSFPSQETVAKQLGVCTRTVKRAVKRLRAANLAIIYAARMAEHRADGGQYAHNVYDFTPMFIMCGEDVVPHSLKSALEHLNAEGRWVRGLQRQDSEGSVVAEITASNSDGGTNVSPGANGASHREGASTGGHASHTNHNPHSFGFENKNKYNPPTRLRSVGDDLDGDCQVVFGILKDLGYGPYKAVVDLRGYGAQYVQRCIDYVKGCQGVNNPAKLINHIMGKDLDELYRTKPQSKSSQKPKSSPPQPSAPQSTRAAGQSNRTPSALDLEKGQSVEPAPPAAKPSVAEQAASLRGNILAHPEADIAKACARAAKDNPKMAKKFEPSARGLTWRQLVEQMSLIVLVETGSQIEKLKRSG